MTACVNRKHTKKVAAVVTASLVGALSLGVAPVAAMAEGDIALLASDSEAVEGADVTYKGGKDGDVFPFTGLKQGLVPVSVDYGAELDALVYPANANRSERREGEFYYFYVALDGTGTWNKGVSYTDADGNSHVVEGTVNYGAPSDPGSYAVVVGQWGTTDWTAYVETAAVFTISEKNLEGSTIYQGNDVTDTTFDYSGAKDSLLVSNFLANTGVAINGVPVNTSDLYMSIYTTTGKKLASTDQLTPGTEYVLAYEWRTGDDHRTEHKFTVQPLDLSKATVVGKAVDASWPVFDRVDGNVVSFNDAVAYINGIENDNGLNAFDLVLESNASSTGVSLKITGTPEGTIINRENKGAYTVEIVAGEDNQFVTGSKTFTVYYGDDAATVDFGNNDLVQADGSYYVDLNEDQSFDATDIIATLGDGTRVKNKDLSISYLNADGTAAESGADCLKSAGTHYVVVSYNKDVKGNRIVASAMAKVVTSYTVTMRSDVFMSYDGKNVEYSTSDVYTGEDLSQNMAFRVTAGDKDLVQGTDYTVKFETLDKDLNLVAVDEIVDAGVYFITVTGETFNGTAMFAFVVDPMTPDNIVVDHDLVTGIDSTLKVPTGYVTYTGEALAPTFSFYDAKGNKIEVPEGAYTVDSYDLVEKDGTLIERDVEVKDEGFYQAHLSSADTIKNFDLSGVSVIFEVTSNGIFLDVPTSGKWYSQSVYNAYALKYINGYGDGKFFGPENPIKRGDVAVVLYNMSGASRPGEVSEDVKTEYKTYTTKMFGDVDEGMYYNEAIGWAAKLGIVNGYEGSFRPEDPVTAEEFAAMLANYAAAKGADIEAAEADLSAFGDADQISGWAKESVEWAVANDVMGGYELLRPQEQVSRARVAAMAVNYQPQQADDVLIPETK